MYQSITYEARKEHDMELLEEEETQKNIIRNVYDRFINEDDFPKGKADAYREYVKRHISYMYEPLDEDFDEARYFTEDYEKSFTKKCIYNMSGNSKRISSIQLQKPVTKNQ